MNPLISVIIPTYNRENTIEKSFQYLTTNLLKLKIYNYEND